jgi:hypothetical protein
MANMSEQVFRQRSKQADSAPKTAPAVPADPLATVAMSQCEVEALSQPKVEPKPEPKTPASPALPAVDTSHRVRVLEDGKVMLGSCRHKFKAGSVLDANHYDSREFAQLLRVLKTERIKG